MHLATMLATAGLGFFYGKVELQSRQCVYANDAYEPSYLYFSYASCRRLAYRECTTTVVFSSFFIQFQF